MKWKKRHPDQPECVGLTPGEQAQLARKLGLRNISKILETVHIICSDCEEEVEKTGHHHIRCRKCAELRRRYLKGVYQKWLMRNKRLRPETILVLLQATYLGQWIQERWEIDRQIQEKVSSLKPRSFHMRLSLYEEMLEDYRKKNGPLPMEDGYWPPDWPPKKELLRILRQSQRSTKRLTK